jgi:hypothetical protein
MTQKANEPSDSQRECDKAKRVQIARCATLGSSFYNQSRIKTIILTIIIVT